MSAIKQFLDLTTKKKPVIAVVGDILVDEYYKINAERVSPEFPIPVMESNTLEPSYARPGGAGNVCEQFRHFDVDVKVFGFIDRRVKEVMSHFDLSGCVELPLSAHVPIKRRLYQGTDLNRGIAGFPLCRWDIESDCYYLSDAELRRSQREIYRNLCSIKPEVIIYSDYSKGLFSLGMGASLWANHHSDALKIVDPKDGPAAKWKGVDIFKPNAKEAKSLSGESTVWDQLKYFEEALGCTTVTTSGGDGVYWCHNGGDHHYEPSKSVDVKSVVGAGDCFTAFLALALAHGMDMKDAVEVAYEVGAVYVQKGFNDPVTRLETHRIEDPLVAKYTFPEDNDGLVFTNGCFDVLHDGHIQLLHFAKSCGKKLVVALNSDESVKRLKGESRPINSLEKRMRAIASLECVDYVVSFSEDTPYDIIKKMMPDTLVKGADWAGKIVGSELVRETKTFSLVKDEEGTLSTTRLISD